MNNVATFEEHGPNWVPTEKWEEIVKLVPIVGVNAIIVNDDGKVLLVKRNNPPVQGEWWYPGGGIRYGESILEALYREVKQETGLDIETAKLAHITSSVWKERHTIEINFLVTVKKGEIKLDSESSEAAWFSPDGLLHSYLKKLLKSFSHQILSYRESEQECVNEIVGDAIPSSDHIEARLTTPDTLEIRTTSSMGQNLLNRIWKEGAANVCGRINADGIVITPPSTANLHALMLTVEQQKLFAFLLGEFKALMVLSLASGNKIHENMNAAAGDLLRQLFQDHGK